MLDTVEIKTKKKIERDYVLFRFVYLIYAVTMRIFLNIDFFPLPVHSLKVTKKEAASCLRLLVTSA